MAVTAAFDSAIPDNDSVYFTNGERAVTLASDIAAVPNGNYRLSKMLNVRAGVYLLEAMLRPAGTITIGGTTITGSGLVRTQIDIPQGDQRLDVTLDKSGAGDCYVAMLIFQSDRVAYASSAAGWVFDTQAIALADVPKLPDPRLSMTVFGVLPNWRDGITERVTFATSILSSETGIEQRRSIRERPRRSFELEFFRHDVLRARLDNFLVGVGIREVLLPLWHEQYRSVSGVIANESAQRFPTQYYDEVITQYVDPGVLNWDTLDVAWDASEETWDNTPTGSEDYPYQYVVRRKVPRTVNATPLDQREFRAGDAVLLTNGDPLEQEVLIVETVDATTGAMTWRTRPAKDWPVGTRIVPLRKAHVSEQASMSVMADRIASVRIRFNLIDPITEFAADWGYCVPLWRFKVDRRDDLSIDVDRNIYSIDNQSGPVRLSNPGGRAFVSTRSQVMLRGREMVRSFRSFLAAARGRAQRFYAPAYVQALVPHGEALGGPFIEAERTGFMEMMPAPQEARRILAVVFKDDSPTLYRNVLGITEGLAVGDHPVERYALDEPLPDIRMSTVERVEWVIPSRFDQDAFELKHLVDQSEAVRISVIMRSVDGTGMPWISCDVTSHPYPLSADENLDVGFTMDSGNLTSAPKPIEELNVVLAPTGGTLFMPLVSYGNYAPEATDTNMTPLSGALFMPLVTNNLGNEALNTTMAPVGGVLQSILIGYNNYAPEANNVNFAPVSGALSPLYEWDHLDVAWDDTEVAWDDIKES